jgi:MFS family permease
MRGNSTVLNLLKDKTYVKYWLAVVMSFLGDGITRMSVIYLISQMTDDSLMIALVIFAQLMPSAVLSVFIGPLIDRFPKRLIMVFADLTRAVLILSMIFFVHSPWMLLFLVLLNGVAKTIFEPARIASVRRIVGNHSIPTAIALFQSTVQTVNIVGPMLAGLLLVINNPVIIFSISAATYLCSALLIGNIGVLKEDQAQANQQSKPPEPYFTSLKMGIQGTMAVAPLRFLLIFMIPVMLMLGLFGLLEAVFAVGAIGGALVGPKLMSRYLGPGLLLQASVALYGFAMVAVQPLVFLHEANGLLPVYVWCVIAGLSQGFFNVPLSSTFLMKLPKELVGRGLALFNGILNLCTILGVIAGGWLAQQVGIPTVLVYAGVMLLVVAASSRLMKGYNELQGEFRQQKATDQAGTKASTF